jgi:hypothetical protein
MSKTRVHVARFGGFRQQVLLCNAISVATVHDCHAARFGTEMFNSSVLLGFTMLCDVISAVTELMVRVLHSSLHSMSVIGVHDVGGVEAKPCV